MLAWAFHRISGIAIRQAKNFSAPPAGKWPAPNLRGRGLPGTGA